MTPQTFIFIGRSGCGKGTQVKLLEEYIQAHDTVHHKIFHLETGAQFREFIQGNGYSNKLSHAIYLTGERQPDFLAVWVWSHIFVDKLKGGEHLIIDGTPRSLNEAKILDTAMKFYGRGKPFVVYLNVSRAWSEKHLLSRGRSDDIETEIKKRLDWFDNDVMPAIEFYRADPNVNFIDINGEQSIEDVQKEMISKIFS